MLYFYRMQKGLSATRFALTCAVLVLAGFGCRPVLDAQVARQNQEEDSKPSEWIVTSPVLSHTLETDGTGQVNFEMRTKAGAVVTVALTGEDISGERIKTSTAREDGMVYVNWRIRRGGIFLYDGNVAFQNVIVKTFNGEYNAF